MTAIRAAKLCSTFWGTSARIVVLTTLAGSQLHKTHPRKVKQSDKFLNLENKQAILDWFNHKSYTALCFACYIKWSGRQTTIRFGLQVLVTWMFVIGPSCFHQLRSSYEVWKTGGTIQKSKLIEHGISRKKSERFSYKCKPSLFFSMCQKTKQEDNSSEQIWETSWQYSVIKRLIPISNAARRFSIPC